MLRLLHSCFAQVSDYLRRIDLRGLSKVSVFGSFTPDVGEALRPLQSPTIELVLADRELGTELAAELHAHAQAGWTKLSIWNVSN